MPPPPQNFEQIVHDYYGDVFRFALSLVGTQSDAIDLTQQAFLRYASKGHQLRDQTKVKNWLFRGLKNEFIDQKRRSKRFQHVNLDAVPISSLPLASNSRFSTIDTGSALRALQSLDKKYRIPLTLFYLEGMSYRDIAGLMDIPEGTVMSRLSRGKERLRCAFSSPTQPQP